MRSRSVVEVCSRGLFSSVCLVACQSTAKTCYSHVSFLHLLLNLWKITELIKWQFICLISSFFSTMVPFKNQLNLFCLFTSISLAHMVRSTTASDLCWEVIISLFTCFWPFVQASAENLYIWEIWTSLLMVFCSNGCPLIFRPKKQFTTRNKLLSSEQRLKRVFVPLFDRRFLE